MSIGSSERLRTLTLMVTLPLTFFFVAAISVVVASGMLIIESSPTKFISQAKSGLYSIFSAPPPEPIVLGESKVAQEARPLIIRRYLASYNSPLAAHADYIIEISNKYRLDWRLLVAIAGQESTFGKNVPYSSHNAWGWGVHKRGTRRFSSWEEGIERVGRSLREDFLDKGLTTPEELMRKYAPVSLLRAGGKWARGVEYFMWEMENF